jgi:hypothetical protein
MSHTGVLFLNFCRPAGLEPANTAGRAAVFSPAKTAPSCERSRAPKQAKNLGFDAVGIGDVNRDGILDALLAAATGDHVYVVASVRSSLHGHH